MKTVVKFFGMATLRGIKNIPSILSLSKERASAIMLGLVLTLTGVNNTHAAQQAPKKKSSWLKRTIGYVFDTGDIDTYGGVGSDDEADTVSPRSPVAAEPDMLKASLIRLRETLMGTPGNPGVREYFQELSQKLTQLRDKMQTTSRRPTQTATALVARKPLVQEPDDTVIELPSPKTREALTVQPSSQVGFATIAQPVQQALANLESQNITIRTPQELASHLAMTELTKESAQLMAKLLNAMFISWQSFDEPTLNTIKNAAIAFIQKYKNKLSNDEINGLITIMLQSGQLSLEEKCRIGRIFTYNAELKQLKDQCRQLTIVPEDPEVTRIKAQSSAKTKVILATTAGFALIATCIMAGIIYHNMTSADIEKNRGWLERFSAGAHTAWQSGATVTSWFGERTDVVGEKFGTAVSTGYQGVASGGSRILGGIEGLAAIPQDILNKLLWLGLSVVGGLTVVTRTAINKGISLPLIGIGKK